MKWPNLPLLEKNKCRDLKGTGDISSLNEKKPGTSNYVCEFIMVLSFRLSKKKHKQKHKSKLT